MMLRRTVTKRDLLALADGSLPASRRVWVERAVADSPELQAILDAQRRALAAIDDAASERAPMSLRARLELLREPQPRSSKRRFAVPRLVPAGALAAAAVVAAIVLAVLGGGAGVPTVAQAALLANRPAITGAPPQNGNGPTLKGVSAAGLPFPYWDDLAHFHAVGVRHDRLDGRLATTVFYRHGDTRIAYTILSGGPVPFGFNASGTTKNGVRVWTFTSHGMRVATWLRRGHTCVLAGPGDLPVSILVRLASWQGDGKIPY